MLRLSRLIALAVFVTLAIFLHTSYTFSRDAAAAVKDGAGAPGKPPPSTQSPPPPPPATASPTAPAKDKPTGSKTGPSSTNSPKPEVKPEVKPGTSPSAKVNRKHRFGDSGDADIFLVFGSSASAVKFQWLDQLPSTKNPIGNPDWPGIVNAGTGEPNFVGMMTSRFNERPTFAYSYAIPGARLLRHVELDKPAGMDVPTPNTPKLIKVEYRVATFPNQVDRHLEMAAKKELWQDGCFEKVHSDRIAIVTWFGLNDLLFTFERPDIDYLIEQMAEEHTAQMRRLYDQAHIRSFNILTTPPFHLMPRLKALPAEANKKIERSVHLLNSLIKEKAAAFVGEYKGKTSKTDSPFKGTDEERAIKENAEIQGAVCHNSTLLMTNNDLKVRWLNTSIPIFEVMDNFSKYGAPNAECHNKDGRSCIWYDAQHAGLAMHELIAKSILTGKDMETLGP